MPTANQFRQFSSNSQMRPMNQMGPPMGGGQMQPQSSQYRVEFDPWMSGNIGRNAAVAEKFKEQRLADMREGSKRGEKLFGEGSLGRIDETQNNELLEMMKRRMGGYTSAEYGAMRDQNNRELERKYAGSKKELMKAQGAAGTSGAAGSAQFAKMLKDKDRGAQESYQDLLIKNIEGKKAGAADYANALKGSQASRQFNLGQQEKELLNRFQTEMGYASLGSAERAAASQFSAAVQQQQMAANKTEKGK